MGKEFVVDSLEDMCALMCDNNTEGLEESDLPIKMTTIGYSTHDCEAWYECPSCRTQYGSWGFYHNHQKGGDVFTCSCGQKLYVPK